MDEGTGTVGQALVTPTHQAVPTYTPTPPATVTPTETATPTLIPATETPTPEAEAVEDEPAVVEATPVEVASSPTPAEQQNRFTVTSAANLRTGPGTEYTLAGAAAAGESFAVQGRSQDNQWLEVCCINNQPIWIFAALGSLDGAAEGLPVVAALPLPTPAAATPTPAVAEQQLTLASQPVAADSQPPATTHYPYPPGGPITNHPGTAGEFFADAQYKIVHYKVLGEGENNGGIFNQGGQHHIFVNVIDQNGNGINGVVLRDAIGDKLNVITGDKGPGRTEITMYWDGYKLYVASDLSGPVTSQISNRMNIAFPHIPDVVGKLGSIDNEYSVCPTPDVRCSPPFYHVHFSYEITFQKVR